MGPEVLKQQPPKSRVYNRDTYKRIKDADWDPSEVATLIPGAPQQQQQQQRRRRGRQRGTDGTGGAAPEVLHVQRLLGQAVSLADLRAVLQEYGHHMDAIAIAAAITKVPKVVLGKSGTPDVRSAQELLNRLVPRLLEALPELGVRELCNVLWGLAKSGCRPDAEVVDAIVGALLKSGNGSNGSGSDGGVSALQGTQARELAMVAIGAAVLAPRHEPLWAAISAAGVSAAAGGLDGQGAANLLWAVAHAGRSGDAALATALCGWLARPGAAGGMKPVELASAAWALATLRVGGGDAAAALSGDGGAASALDAVAAAAVPRLLEFTPSALQNLLWAVGKLQSSQPSLMAAAAAQLTAAGGSSSGGSGTRFVPAQPLLTAGVVATAAWAAARCGGGCGGAEAALVGIAATALVSAPGAFSPQDAATTVWAAARLGQGDARWWRNAASALHPHLGRYRAQELAMLAAAVANRPPESAAAAAAAAPAASATYGALYQALGAEAASRPQQFGAAEAAQVLGVFEREGFNSPAAVAAGHAFAESLAARAPAALAGVSARRLQQLLSGLRHLGVRQQALEAALAAALAAAEPASPRAAAVGGSEAAAV